MAKFINRIEDSKLTSWYFEIDRRLLGCVLLLIALSAVFVVSAGSVAAERIGGQFSKQEMGLVAIWFEFGGWYGFVACNGFETKYNQKLCTIC